MRARQQRRIMMRQLVPLTDRCSAVYLSAKVLCRGLPSMVNSRCDDSQLEIVFLSQRYHVLCRRARVLLTCLQRSADEDRLYRGQDGEAIPDPLDILLGQLTRAPRNEGRRKIMLHVQTPPSVIYSSTVDGPP